MSENTLTLHRNAPDVGFAYALAFALNNSSNVQTTYALINGSIVSNTAGSEFGELNFYTTTSSSLTKKMTLKSSGVLNMSSCPTSTVGLSTGDIWSDSGTLKIVP